MISFFLYPWRIEVRSTVFHPWKHYAHCRSLNEAMMHGTYLPLLGGKLARIRVN